MPRIIATLLKAETKAVAEELAEREATFLRSLGEPWVVAETGSWVDSIFSEFRDDLRMRQSVHRDGLAALAGVLNGGPAVNGHVSDWLRCHCYLYGDLAERHLAAVRDFEIGFFSRRFGAAGAGLPTVLHDLHAQLADARACFRLLPDIDAAARSEHDSPEAISRYWNEAASASAMFTIDWASFGRPELFSYNGYRAAWWLRNAGFASSASHILQIGCGMGRIERHLALLAERVYGVDISEEMIRCGEGWVAGHPNVSLLRTDGRSIPLPDASLDTVFSFLVFIHLNSPDLRADLFRETVRVLRPGGYFLFTMQDGLSRRARSESSELGERVGLETISVRRVNSRRINSFNYRWDWLFILRKPARQ